MVVRLELVTKKLGTWRVQLPDYSDSPDFQKNIQLRETKMERAEKKIVESESESEREREM